MADPASVTVEFFGIPRQRAGLPELVVPAGTVDQALAVVEHTCPNLAGLRTPEGRLAAHYLLSINGGHFVTHLGQRVEAGDHLLILSADAGG